MFGQGDSELPLAGTLVVTVEQAVAAPLATRHLADLGARVIKLERRDGGDFARRYDAVVHGESSYFVWLNAGKQSVALDVKHARSGDILDRLLSRADVFVENLAPGSAERLGLGSERLAARYPSLITCSVSGYGPTGPMSDRRAYDALLQSETGFVATTGTPEAGAKAGISVVDIAAGMYAFSGVLAAMLARSRSGVGTHVSVSLLDAMTEWMSQPALARRYAGAEPERLGTQHSTIVPYGLFACAGGASIHLAVQNDVEWARLCELVLERPDLITDRRLATNIDRVRHRKVANGHVNQALAVLPLDEARARLDEAHIANTTVGTVGDLLKHPQLAARRRWRDVSTPSGPATLVQNPLIDRDDEQATTGVPALGQHTVEVLDWIGYERSVVDDLVREGVVGPSVG